ncbi:protein D7-like [Haliotis rufescens]|uniref:protein D7-like n=1 Tax=Haliotis rufescens TaxID=6454 RepID=UPI00201FAE3D|nr:protein D7-like [Haliotis rufescens]XP_046367392.2 protein D7-like [Haliotis rufescens]XP_046367393.2 protein D7-like [Haliotis rufescens]XP_046367394.2 protein D7-like [Haliotis rufescens]XP_048241449.1 protein D7-like [Haliotis rufescens]XP_048241450.1 protein D7-like [Haliotis rufescens]
MSEFVVPDPEELLECPYDKVHMVRAKRFQYHLMKCRKNWPGSEFSVCPFNAKHEMPKPELRYHMASCCDRAVLERDIAYEKSKMNGEGTFFKGCTDVPPYTNHLACDESWDMEMNSCPRIGVDPDFFDKFKFINLSGYAQAQKRQYYENLKSEFQGQTVKKPLAGKNPSGKLRLPQESSKASKLSEHQQPVQHPANVFAYSLSMAGLGRGRGKSAVDAQPMGISNIFNMGIGRGLPAPGLRDLLEIKTCTVPKFVVPAVQPTGAGNVALYPAGQHNATQHSPPDDPDTSIEPEDNITNTGSGIKQDENSPKKLAVEYLI